MDNTIIEELIKNDSLSEFIRKDDFIFDFLIKTAISAIQHVGYLNPNPCEIIEITEENLNEFVLIMKTDLSSIIRFFKNGGKDKQFAKTFPNKNVLKLIYFFTFRKSYSISHISCEHNVIYKKIELIYEQEEDFENSSFLFHGTSKHCLYSILRNSLKSMSGTSFMRNGSVYGNGIYLSDDAYFSSLYCTEYHHDEYKALLVCNVKNLNKIKLQSNIYVQQENDVKLCGIIFFKKFTELTDNINLSFFNSKMSEEINSEHVMRSRRFLKEMDRLMNKEIPEIEAIIFKSHLEPILFYIRPCPDSKLKQDCVELGISSIVLSVSFPRKENISQEYPFSPPLVRILRPIFKRGTGRVSEGGSICLDSIFSSGWNPSLGLEKLAISIIDIISNESQEYSTEIGGRIDRERLNEEYSFEDFKRTFHNTGIYHDWTK